MSRLLLAEGARRVCAPSYFEMMQAIPPPLSEHVAGSNPLQQILPA